MGRMYNHLLNTYAAFALLAMSGDNGYYAASNKSEVNYEPSKLSGFTTVKGRKHLSKKKRKQKNKIK